MCGICGYQGTIQDGLIQKMAQTMAHRGPDADGFMENPQNQIALGHRRLSIIDLSPEAHQPLKNEDNTVFLICNGEIYNYIELRAKLVQQGHKFKSRTDSEALLHLYEEEGTEMLNKLNGIFAFAIYDSIKNELFCARDHLGVKPFYYNQTNNFFAFASELKALLQIPQISKDIDPFAIHNYISFLWSPSPVTILKSVRKLEPGHGMIIKKGKIVRHWQYYDIPYNQHELIMSEEENINLVQNKILSAVERQLMSDVPVGAFLSGGLDSSAIVAMMKKINPYERPKCYTISFDQGKNYEGFVNDLPYARKVAQHLDVALAEVVIECDIVKNFEKMIYLLDEPQADLAPINIMLICQMAREQGIKVLLSGAGGDDIFSGYRRHVALYLERYWSWLPKPLRVILQTGASSLPINNPNLRRFRKLFENASLNQNDRLIAYFFWLKQDKIQKLYSSDMQQNLQGYNAFKPMHEHLNALGAKSEQLNKMLYLESKTFLPDHNLNYTDKMSMASGIEVRVPLLDLELVELCTQIPVNLKQKAMTGKYIFKKAMEPFLPQNVIYRPKGAMPGSLRNWIKNDLTELVHDTLSREKIQKRGWFNYQAVHQLIKDNENGKIDAAYPIWALVSLEKWASLFLDN